MERQRGGTNNWTIKEEEEEEEFLEGSFSRCHLCVRKWQRDLGEERRANALENISFKCRQHPSVITRLDFSNR